MGVGLGSGRAGVGGSARGVVGRGRGLVGVRGGVGVRLRVRIWIRVRVRVGAHTQCAGLGCATDLGHTRGQHVLWLAEKDVQEKK